MNEGVKILLERMKTNPEEFTDVLGIRMSKWGSLIAQFREYLDRADIEAIEEAYKPLMQQHFTEQVMKELLAPEEDDSLGKWYTKQENQGSATLSAGVRVTPTIPSIPFNTNAPPKKHQTLFGKLFNYS